MTSNTIFEAVPLTRGRRIWAGLAIFVPLFITFIILGPRIWMLNLGFLPGLIVWLVIMVLPSGLLILLGLQFFRSPHYQITDTYLKIQHTIGNTKIPYDKIEYVQRDRFLGEFAGTMSTQYGTSETWKVGLASDPLTRFKSFRFALLAPMSCRRYGQVPYYERSCVTIKIESKEKVLVVTPKDVEGFLSAITRYVTRHLWIDD